VEYAKSQFISAKDLIRNLVETPDQVRFLDVRSEDEFTQNTIPHFKNIPILNNQERHLVGICYKEKGQVEAIKLGLELVSNRREQLIKDWKNHFKDSNNNIVSCWRGGLRSQMACQWLAEVGIQSHRVEGGTKAIRNEFIQELLSTPELMVISGPTGSGKTKLLNSINKIKVDLEEIAKHRGSAFGRYLHLNQPSQVSFENQLALQFKKLKTEKKLFIEDESKAIGLVYLPKPLLNKIREAPLVKINMDIEKRISNIYQSYVAEPLSYKLSPDTLKTYFEESLTKIKSKLGGQKESEIRILLRDSFLTNDLNKHREWIRELLVHYYDKAYEYSFMRTNHPVAFQGDWNSCLQWIQSQSSSQKP
jgi:tRNA 2-selenouridine synthase